MRIVQGVSRIRFCMREAFDREVSSTECRVEDFRFKEVVNVCSGQRLGCVCDVVIDIGTGRVQALVVPGRCRFLGLFWREEEYILPWENIRRIGNDIILVEVEGEYRRGKREKHPWFTWQFDEQGQPRSPV